MIADGIARRRGDPALLARAARAAGCVRGFSALRPAGALPHLDLDRALPRAGDERAWRTVEVPGCRVSLPSFEGRPGAERAAVEIDAAGAGAYDIVLDFGGEARLAVDGGAWFHHGDERRYGPRVSAARVHLSRGRHQLLLRLASGGG